ncbi:MAG TPA: 3-hydroxyacyl-CoA dehydrogenase NAD-binding domain-containing protein [Candidatus Tumulicola sp.]
MDERILIAGGGTMGAGIASIAARAGYRVVVVEPNDAVVSAARDRIARSAQRASSPEIVERIEFVSEAPASSDATIAIEAVTERIDVKQAVLQRLSAAIGEDALLATNTSSFSVHDLSRAVTHPERFLGLHFFNPPEAMQLIEIVPTETTDDSAIERASGFAQRLGKTAVVASDTPGFIVNRVARPFYLQSMLALAAGVASAPELDALARSLGFRMGPFELMDLIGLDVNLATTESVYERTGEERLAPVAMQRELVAAGSLGRKTGRGFYDYREGSPERFEPDVQSGVERNADESAVVIGFGLLADELATALEARFESVQRIERDDALDELNTSATIVFDVGDGLSDRKHMLISLDEMFAPATVIFSDAYATDVGGCAKALQRPERVVGFGVLGSLEEQSCIEIVDSEEVADDTLELAQDIFESLGKGVVLVEDVPGLYVGRTIGSIVNEAMVAVQEDVAEAADIDLALQLGANYPRGPITWGREIGGRRIARILERVADEDGREFGPDRSLWLLDLAEEEPEAQPAAADLGIPGLTER